MASLLLDKFNKNLGDIDFIHHFDLSMIGFFRQLLERGAGKDTISLEGKLGELSGEFSVLPEIFYGFLRLYGEFTEHDISDFEEDSFVGLDINFTEFYNFLRKKGYWQYVYLYEWDLTNAKLPMRVGYQRDRKKTKGRNDSRSVTLEFVTLATIAHEFDAEVFYFDMGDVNFRSRTISGTFIEGQNSVTRDALYPHVVDNTLTLNVSLTTRYIFEDMSMYSIFAMPSQPYYFDGFGGKLEIYKMILDGGKFAEFLIPTSKVKTFDEVEEGFDNYNNEIILKPIFSAESRGIMKIKKERGMYYLTEKHNTTEIKKANFKVRCEEILKSGPHILQPFLESKTLQNEPFDIRIMAERGKGGKFQTGYYPRIGSARGFVSNISAGGRAQQIDKFLRKQFPKHAKSIKKQLDYLSEEFPEYLQGLYKHTFFSVGLDVAVVREKGGVKLQLFEVSVAGIAASPESGMHLLKAQLALEYYRYIYELELKKAEGEIA